MLIQPGQQPAHRLQGVKHNPQDAHEKIRLMRQVAGQHGGALHQRDDQHGDHGDRHHRNEFTHHTRDVEHRCKRNDRRRHRSCYRRQYLISSLHGCPGKRLALLAMCIDILPHHNGVIDHNPQGHQKGKHGKHI